MTTWLNRWPFKDSKSLISILLIYRVQHWVMNSEVRLDRFSIYKLGRAIWFWSVNLAHVHIGSISIWQAWCDIIFLNIWNVLCKLLLDWKTMIGASCLTGRYMCSNYLRGRHLRVLVAWQWGSWCLRMSNIIFAWMVWLLRPYGVVVIKRSLILTLQLFKSLV